MRLRKDAKHQPPIINNKLNNPPQGKTELYLANPNKPKPKVTANLSIIKNNGDRPNLKALLEFKCVISRQLVKMPRNYITKTLFDRWHQSIVATHNDKVIAGTCFRCFPQQPFAELVFLAVDTNYKECGLGSQIMDSLKELLQTRKVKLLLTYADYSAIGFFRKQAFDSIDQTPDKQWSGYIKAYDGGTLMQCKVDSKFKYTQFKETLLLQRNSLITKIKEIFKGQIKYQIATLEHIKEIKIRQNRSETLPADGREREINRQDLQNYTLSLLCLPGALENNWCPQRQAQLQTNPEISLMLERYHAVECIRKLALSKILIDMQRNKEIALPLDFPTIEKKILSATQYNHNDELCADLRSIPTYLRSIEWEDLEEVNEMERKMEPILQLLRERKLVIQIDPVFKEIKTTRTKVMKN